MPAYLLTPRGWLEIKSKLDLANGTNWAGPGARIWRVKSFWWENLNYFVLAHSENGEYECQCIWSPMLCFLLILEVMLVCPPPLPHAHATVSPFNAPLHCLAHYYRDVPLLPVNYTRGNKSVLKRMLEFLPRSAQAFALPSITNPAHSETPGQHTALPPVA